MEKQDNLIKNRKFCEDNYCNNLAICNNYCFYCGNIINSCQEHTIKFYDSIFCSNVCADIEF